MYVVRAFFHHDLCAENEVHGPGRQRAEEGQWFRLHGQGKTASQTDAGIVKMALAVLDADVRRTMYQQPLLSQDKFTGMLLPQAVAKATFTVPDLVKVLLQRCNTVQICV